MEHKEAWVLVYKFKMASKNRWLVHSEAFGSSGSLFTKEKKLSDSLGKDYATIHVGVSTIQD